MSDRKINIADLNAPESTKKYLEAALQTADIIKQVKTAEHDLSVSVFKSYQDKVAKIEAKQACMRVQFLDWLSIKLAEWSKKVKDMSDRINSPCIIKLPVKE